MKTQHRAGAGWRDAKCRVHTLEGAVQDAELFKIADEHLIMCNRDGVCVRARHARRSAGACDERP